MAVSFSDRVTVPRGVVSRVVGGSTVLLNSQTGRYFTLDEIGTRVWTALLASATIQAALDRLLAEFRADPQQLRLDVESLIADLVERGLVEIQRG
jgi:coenzyme PQQ synthesis protein D (PqqD)